jgi:anti-sigma regulatory factor (Ser/Thr protein kinase)
MLLAVTERWRVAEVQRLASQAADQQGFGEGDVGRVGIVATELATNLVKHAGGGEIAIASFDDGEGQGLELLALDKGPGISDLQRALGNDDFTAGIAGTGLGAVRRNADVFAISTRLGHGTAIVARLTRADRTPSQASHVVAGLCSPYPGEAVCGDGWVVAPPAESSAVLLADGVGHGPDARKASLRAIEIFLQCASAAPEEAGQSVHRALAATRGAAIAIAQIEPSASGGRVNFVGIGNITAALIDGAGVRRMASQNGTAGHVAPRIRGFQYPYSGVPTVILHSDGLTSRWDLGEYPGLTTAHPSLIAGILYRDFRRGRDDASIVAVRRNSGCHPAS